MGSQPDPDDFPQVRMAYAGRRLTAKGSAVHAWESPEGLHLFADPMVAGAAIGLCYDFTVAGGDSYFTKGVHAPERASEVRDQQWITEATVQDRAAREVLAFRRHSKRFQKDHGLEADLGRVRAAYRNLPPNQRRAFLVWLVTYIEN